MQAAATQTVVLDNGLTLVMEPMQDVQSAAFSLLVPGGSINDPPGQNGSAAVLCDLITRGAGNYDSKQLSLVLDNLGLQRSENAGAMHLSFSGATLAENLTQALTVYADIVQRPLLPEEQFAGARAGIEQALMALEDEPRQKVIQELRRRCYPDPWGKPSDGDRRDLPNLTCASVTDHYRRCFRPNETILGVAGRFDPHEIQDVVEREFGDWARQDVPEIVSGECGDRVDHIDHDSTQTQIGIAYQSVPYAHPEYFAAWAAVGVLSGGMSSRLFTEVREKRGLCYAVYASLSSLRDQARVLCYAGTTVERAQETLDVTLQELVRLADGIEASELDRCRARAKSSLIMQQESTIARSAAVARDWYHLGRIMTLQEIHDQIESLTIETVLDHVQRFPARDFTVVTIGPQALEVCLEVP